MSLLCSECLRFQKCTRTWKGTARNDCYIPGIDQWGTCAGCGIMRPKTQADLFPCPICAHKDMMTPAMWEKVRQKAATHTAAVMESLS